MVPPSRTSYLTAMCRPTCWSQARRRAIQRPEKEWLRRRVMALSRYRGRRRSAWRQRRPSCRTAPRPPICATTKCPQERGTRNLVRSARGKHAAFRVKFGLRSWARSGTPHGICLTGCLRLSCFARRSSLISLFLTLPPGYAMLAGDGRLLRYCCTRVARSPARPKRSMACCQARNSSTVSV